MERHVRSHQLVRQNEEKSKHKFIVFDIGSAVVKNMSGPQSEKVKKELQVLF